MLPSSPGHPRVSANVRGKPTLTRMIVLRRFGTADSRATTVSSVGTVGWLR
jgi:hypothetical protein